MSSLTDIIFLLLIFFMLTSSMVQINIQLPESDSKTVAPSDLIVMVTKDGKTSFNGRKMSTSQIESAVRNEVKKQTNKDNATLSIVAEVGVPWKKVNELMGIASRLKLKANIATQPRK